MTAYGHAHIETSIGRFVVEIQSVNRKYLEVNISLPKELWRFDTEIRKWISERITRGQVQVKVSAVFVKGQSLVVRPNIALAKQVKEAWDVIAEALHVAPMANVDLLSHHSDILQYEEDDRVEEEVRDSLRETVNLALDAVMIMKKKEGAALQKELEEHLLTIGSQVEKITAQSDSSSEKYRTKLKERIEQVVPGSVENEERILREICLFAEKVDIAEEITRLKSHLDQCKNIMQSEQESMGKTIEFLTQELNREANTIGSKTAETEVSMLAVEMKGVIEKIRQQIQNIE